MIYLLIFTAGIFLGSFFYTLALKFISGEIDTDKFKALMGRSRCPSCGKAIGPLYLIPIFGFLISRGRCGNCEAKISIFYPLSEIFYGTMLCGLYFFYGPTVGFFLMSLVFCTLACISLVDFHTMIIPDSLLVFLLVLFSALIYMGGGSVSDKFFGFLLVTIFMLLMMFIFPGSFGGGDLKLMALCSLYFGLNLSIVFLEVTLVGGAVIAVIIALLKGRRDMKVKIPFGPFIVLGFAVTEFVGPEILLLYYSAVRI